MDVQRAPVIRCEGLGKAYLANGDENASEIRALSSVDLHVEAGEFLVLMGASGSGKSTLLYLLGGLESASEGKIQIDDARVDSMNEAELAMLRRQRVGFVFQAINLVPHFTILENLLVPAYLVHKDRKQAQLRAQTLLETLGVGDLSSRLPPQTSGGQQQRAAIARALINSPTVLFADEPTGALNSSSSQAVLDAFQQLNDRGQTIVMATHDVYSASRGDRVVYLKDGEAVGEFRFSHRCAHIDGSDSTRERETQLLDWLTGYGW